jgi:hypothetical protein
LAVRIGVENIANSLSFIERMISDLNILVIAAIGKSNEELATRESVEVGSSISL